MRSKAITRALILLPYFKQHPKQTVNRLSISLMEAGSVLSVKITTFMEESSATDVKKSRLSKILTVSQSISWRRTKEVQHSHSNSKNLFLLSLLIHKIAALSFNILNSMEISCINPQSPSLWTTISLLNSATRRTISTFKMAPTILCWESSIKWNSFLLIIMKTAITVPLSQKTMIYNNSSSKLRNH